MSLGKHELGSVKKILYGTERSVFEKSNSLQYFAYAKQTEFGGYQHSISLCLCNSIKKKQRHALQLFNLEGCSLDIGSPLPTNQCLLWQKEFYINLWHHSINCKKRNESKMAILFSPFDSWLSCLWKAGLLYRKMSQKPPIYTVLYGSGTMRWGWFFPGARCHKYNLSPRKLFMCGVCLGGVSLWWQCGLFAASKPTMP